MKRAHFAALAVALLPTGALAEELSVDAIVQRARAIMEHKPANAVCHLSADTYVLDKNGKVEHEDKREGDATLHGDQQDFEPRRAWRDGKELSPDEVAAQREEAKKSQAKQKDQEVGMAPLAAKNADGQRFELLRRESLWGHPAYVIKVSAQRAEPTLANGTLWIDAERFVELKGELVPAKLPAHADWLKVQEQFTLGPKQQLWPALLHIEGAGHLLFVRKGFRSTLTWSNCR